MAKKFFSEHHTYDRLNSNSELKPSLLLRLYFSFSSKCGPIFSNTDSVGLATQKTKKRLEIQNKTLKCLSRWMHPEASIWKSSRESCLFTRDDREAPHGNATKEHDRISLGWALLHPHASLRRPKPVGPVKSYGHLGQLSRLVKGLFLWTFICMFGLICRW